VSPAGVVRYLLRHPDGPVLMKALSTKDLAELVSMAAETLLRIPGSRRAPEPLGGYAAAEDATRQMMAMTAREQEQEARETAPQKAPPLRKRRRQHEYAKPAAKAHARRRPAQRPDPDVASTAAFPVSDGAPGQASAAGY
jgi:hypothetical protein